VAAARQGGRPVGFEPEVGDALMHVRLDPRDTLELRAELRAAPDLLAAASDRRRSLELGLAC
jgi:hypothetical protein